MTDQPQPPQPAPLKSLLRALLGLLIVLSVGLVVAGLVYFSFTLLYQQSVRPARTNTARLDQLETDQALGQGQQAGQMRQFESRLSDLESQRAFDRESLTGLTSRVDTLNTALAQQQQTLDELSQMQLQLDGLQAVGSYNATQAAEMLLTLQVPDPQIALLERDIQLLRSMQYLDQARILLARSNYGEAELSVYNARQELTTLLEMTPESQQPLVSTWMNRMDVIREELPAYPFLAAQDLENAWSSMAQGFSPQAQMAAGLPETPTPTAYRMTPTLYFTPTFTPVPHNTPTMEAPSSSHSP